MALNFREDSSTMSECGIQAPQPTTLWQLRQIDHHFVTFQAGSESVKSYVERVIKG